MKNTEIDRLRQQERCYQISIETLTLRLREIQYRLLKLHSEDRSLDEQRKRVLANGGVVI